MFRAEILVHHMRRLGRQRDDGGCQVHHATLQAERCGQRPAAREITKYDNKVKKTLTELSLPAVLFMP